MASTAITSTSNPRVKRLVRLQKSGAERRASGMFCVERSRELRRALEAGIRAAEFYFTAGEVERDDMDAASRSGAAMFEVTAEVLRKIAYQENPRGFLAVMEAKRMSPAELPGGPVHVVLSGLEKPGNVGAILRSADAAGAAGVLIDSADYDLYNPNCIRASTGAVFAMPVAMADRETILGWLAARGARIIAATPEAAVSYTEADWSGEVAIVVGAEAEGLDASWRAAAELNVSIPMRGTADSLNVSVSAALLMFEAMRGR